MKKRRQLGFFAFLGVLLTVVISCNNSTPETPSATTREVEFWTMQLQPQFTDYFNKAIAQFEAENPDVKILWTDVPWSAMESKILASVSAKTAPDVVNLNPDFAALLAERNAWLELDNLVSESEKSVYLPKIWQASQLDNKTFGIPWYLTTQITIYNTDLFQKAGLEKPPATYQELAEVAKTIKEKTGKYAFFVTFLPEDSSQVLESFIQMGVPLVDKDGKAAFNTPKGRAVFQYWVDLYQNELLPREVLTQGHQRGIQLYQAGETAMLFSGPEFIKAIAENAPTIAEVSQPAPQITGETGKKGVAVMNLVIPRQSDVPELALKFALFVTGDRNQLAFAKEANILPSTVEALEDSYFQNLPEDATQSDRARIVSASQMAQGEVLIPVIEDLKDLKEAIYDNLQGAMLGDKTVDKAAADAALQWNERD
ncbi:MAG: sugar ABC transporter substrate-binding protein [Okeania sp. SIO2H7]|nr:sugar ABC transporter substrate-binding protein [Okeania sp. SIO2H7]